MASLITYNNGLRRIEFTWEPNSKTQIIRLGRLNAKSAKSIKGRVEVLINDKQLNRQHDAETVSWLAELDEKLLSRLRKLGLADGVGMTQITLGEFLEKQAAAHSVSESTKTFYGHTRRNLIAFFGAGRLLKTITEVEADQFRAWLTEHEKLASATVGRRIVAARSIWKIAVRWRLITNNPFVGVRGGSQTNESRKFFVSHEAVQKILDACPDAEWRALVTLARYGGLRTPSEPIALRWMDINWDDGKILIHSAKTAHHEGKATRLIPLYPELRATLMEVFEQAEDGAEFVITRYRDAKQNLGTQLGRIITKAGLEPWPRLWQNMRASRETELMREYGLATACKWIGNSPKVAATHYDMSIDIDADYRRAAGREDDSKAQQKAQETASAEPCRRKTTPTPRSRKPLKNNASDNSRPSRTKPVKGVSWAIQDSNL